MQRKTAGIDTGAANLCKTKAFGSRWKKGFTHEMFVGQSTLSIPAGFHPARQQDKPI
jgi:hypothetical protein